MTFSDKELLKLEEKIIPFIKEAALLIEDTWEKKKKVTYKSGFEPVTEFDPQIETFLRKKLQTLLPTSGFYVEEGESTSEKEYMWSIDPIDGTNNFKGSIPLFFIQVGLAYNRIPILGIIYSPVSQQLFSASKGNGVRYNGKIIEQQTTTDIKKAFIDIDFGGNNGDLDWKLQIFKNLALESNRVRASGGSYGPYILFGGIDAFIVINQKTKIVDQLPRIILMQESGLHVEQFETKGYKVILTTNELLFPHIKRLIQQA